MNSLPSLFAIKQQQHKIVCVRSSIVRHGWSPQGEAKVLKQLTAGKVDLHERRKNIKARMNETDPHALQRRMITFVSEREYRKTTVVLQFNVQSLPSKQLL